MSVVRYNSPFGLRHVDRDEFLAPFDRVFDEVFAAHFPELNKELGVGFFEKQSYPRVDVVDYNDRVEILAEIPGLSKDQITIDVEDNIITLKGEKNSKVEEKEGGTYLRREVKRSSFQRTFTADNKIFNLDKLKAKFEDGVLELTVPKREKEQPKKRTISIG